MYYNIDNSRTGLDTSKNPCSAPAVTALKNYGLDWTGLDTSSAPAVTALKIIDGIMSTIYFD